MLLYSDLVFFNIYGTIYMYTYINISKYCDLPNHCNNNTGNIKLGPFSEREGTELFSDNRDV